MAKQTKRNANGAGMIRKRSDGRWEGRYTLGFDPNTGKQRQISIYGKTHVLIKILVSLDTELLCSIDAEKELILRFKQRHPTKRTLKPDVDSSKRQIKQYIMKCSFPEPQSIDEVRQFLLDKHLVSK